MNIAKSPDECAGIGLPAESILTDTATHGRTIHRVMSGRFRDVRGESSLPPTPDYCGNAANRRSGPQAVIRLPGIGR
jgi:hypothetical protein